MKDTTTKDLVVRLYKEGNSYRGIERLTGLNRGAIAYYCNPTIPKTRVKQRRDRRNAVKAKCIKEKGGKCIVCGFDKFLSALDFHHKDSNSKTDNVAHLFTRNLAFETILKEIEKCVVVCANCHRGLHSNELVLPPDC